ncbi:MAG TPA: DUF1893 domain-containing protein [Deltaproteobacteria bacterium]|nr:DUF1893 domain-containing protein [Deltaproteobacteria bacterium]
MELSRELFHLFLTSEDTLWISRDNSIIYRSEKKGIAPLVDYITEYKPSDSDKDVVVYDRVIGNAAAVLLEKLSCKAAFTHTVSNAALETMNNLGINCFHVEVVSHIKNRQGDGPCPFEEVSIGKSADEFLEFLKQSKKFEMVSPS